LRCNTNGHEDATLRAHSAEALAYLQDSRAIPALLVALRDRAVEVRFWSAFALGELGAWQAVPELEQLARVDHTVLPGWWAVGKEAKNAIEKIKKHSPSGEF
jgi:HEAT repeat protein